MANVEKIRKYYALRDNVQQTINYLSSANDSLLSATDSLNANFKIDNYSKAGIQVKNNQAQIAHMVNFLRNSVIPAINSKIRDLSSEE